MKSQNVILCVDDEANILASLQRTFMSTGYRVLTALGGANGLKVLENEKVDLIIVDQRMPGMSGSEFLREVKQKYPQIISIMLSGFSDFESLVTAINEGEIFRYVSKPWNNKDLVELVETAFYQKEAINIVEDFSKILKKISQNPEHISFETLVEQGSLCLRIQDEGKIISQDSIFRFLNFIFESLGIDKQEKIKMLSGVISKRKGRVVMSVDMGKGVTLKIELPSMHVNQ